MDHENPKLHGVIRQILMDQDKWTASYLEITKINRRKQLFKNSNGTFPNSNTIRLAAKHHPDWFAMLGGGRVQFVGASLPESD